MFDIEEFKAKGMALNGARPNQFYVSVSPPPILNLNQELFTFSCTAASIPPSINGVVEVGYFGRKIKLNGDREFPDWTVTVNVDANWAVRRMMEEWSAAMNRHISNVMDEGVWPTGYKRTATVTQMRQDGAAIATYEMVGLFPSAIDPIALSWDDQNQIERFEITFSYDYWIPRMGDNLAATSQDGTADVVIPPISG